MIWLESMLDHWEAESQRRREYSLEAVLLEAASMSLGAPLGIPSARGNGFYRSRQRVKGKPSPVPTNKRAKVKAARKANVRRAK